ncbi:MAG: sugar phosphate isomerase/epimerase [Candidatus Glassbacteria bacterium]
MERISRRSFLSFGGGIVGATLAAACGGGGSPSAESTPAAGSSAQPAAAPAAMNEYCGLRMGMQSWCFREWDLDRTIAGMQELGLSNIELALVVHLPLDSADEALQAARGKFDAAGIKIDAFGVERVRNDEAQARRLFEVGRKLGVIAISVAPEYEALPLVDRLANEYGIPVGIHNHGPEDKLYAKPEMFRDKLAGLSSLTGLCVDTGHYGRSGVDPLAVIDEFSDRINMVHLKDMVHGGAGEPEWVDRIVGQGQLDLPGLLKRLSAIDFAGPFSLEYESDPSNPLPPMKDCLAAVRQACAAMG